MIAALVAPVLAVALMGSELTVAAETIREWRRDPVRQVVDDFHAEPDRWQLDVLRAFPDPEKRRLAMQACAGPGKSAVLAWCGWNFLACYGDKNQHPNAYALSVTADNLRDNLWKEMAVWRNRSEFLRAAFTWQKERIFANHHPETWFMSARSWSKKADVEVQGRTLSGAHAPFILYLIDESGDIAPAVLRSAEQGLSNCQFGKIMQAGNPTSHEGMLYDAVNNRSHLWTIFRITGDPDDPKRSTRIDIEWAREQIRTYGRDNAWVMAYVLGLFPPTSINTLLGPDDVRAALGRGLKAEDFDYVQKRIGVDVARFGDDRTVLFPRQGLMTFAPVVLRNQRSDAIAARLMVGKQKWGSEIEFIDSTGGWATGVVDSCLRAGVTLHEVNFSERAFNPKYFNRRSEIIFGAAEWVKRGGCLPEGLDEIVREATAAQYWFENGKFRVEEKKQIKIRLGFSPDYWDALCTTFALPDMPAAGSALSGLSGGKMLADYEPLGDRRPAYRGEEQGEYFS